MKSDVKPIDIADACFCLGDYCRALERYFPVLKTQEKDPAANPLATASICYCIGSSYDHLNRSSDALAVKKDKENRFALDNYFKVMEIRKWDNGEDSIRMAEILYCIGVVYSNMNDGEKAREYYKKSYELFRSSGLLLSRSLNSNP